MEARWRQKKKGVVNAQVTVEYKEQSSGFTPAPASQQYVLTSMYVHAHVWWEACWVPRMFWDQLHLCRLFGKDPSAGQAHRTCQGVGQARRTCQGERSNLLHCAAIPLSPCRLRCQLFACLSWWNSFKLKQWNEAQVPKCSVPLLHQHSSEESN